MKKAQSAEDLKLKASFDVIRKQLLQPEYADRLNLQLAHWTLPSDRRLPISLLGYTLGDVLNRSFEELSVTPGIGLKKLNSLVLLLQRAAQQAPPSLPISLDSVPEAQHAPPERFQPLDSEGRFDPSLVSEVLWQEWLETVETYDLSDEKLGRLAPSLRELPTVIWDSPLGAYMGQSIHQIRKLRTHGEKRVRVVLEVFYVVSEMLRQAGRHPRLAMRIAPAFVPEIERWFRNVLARKELPTKEELRENLALVLIDQLEVDVGADVVRLAKGRLGVDGSVATVRQQSRDLNVTRARVYQLLEECERVMAVRWPSGRRYFLELQTRLEREGASADTLEFYRSLYELFYPSKYDRVEEVLQTQ